MRNVAHHLQRRIGQLVAELRQSVGETKGETDPAANEPPPVGIRVVDIVSLFNGLQEKKDGDLDIQQMSSKLEEQRNTKNDELKTMSNGRLQSRRDLFDSS